MTFLTHYCVNNPSEAHLFKAPHKKIYHLISISFMPLVNGSDAFIAVLDSGERELDDFDYNVLATSAIAVFRVANTNPQFNGVQYIFDGKFKSRYFTIVTAPSFNARVLVVIEVDIKKGKREDLILEYLQKSR